MHRARKGLDQHRTLVRYVVGHDMELRAVRDEHLRPAAARVLAVAGLQTRRDVPGRHTVAAAEVAVLAVLTPWLDAPGGAPEDGAQHHTLTGLQVIHVIERFADHL